MDIEVFSINQSKWHPYHGNLEDLPVDTIYRIPCDSKYRPGIYVSVGTNHSTLGDKGFIYGTTDEQTPVASMEVSVAYAVMDGYLSKGLVFYPSEIFNVMVAGMAVNHDDVWDVHDRCFYEGKRHDIEDLMLALGGFDPKEVIYLDEVEDEVKELPDCA